MTPEDWYLHFVDLQDYIGWTEDDTQRVVALGPVVDSEIPAIVEDFYAAIERCPATRARARITDTQIHRLKQTLLAWLRQLFAGRYDVDYVARRCLAGLRHVEIGIEQVYIGIALARLRSRLLLAAQTHWRRATDELLLHLRSLNALLDLDQVLLADIYSSVVDVDLVELNE
jgi:heme-based aerotactic transducer